MVELSQLRPPRGSRKKPTRVGRGIGARKSKTSGRGDKGQLSRRGSRRRPGFEGGQMPLHRRLPKRGFHNLFRVEYAVVNVESLNQFGDGARVTPESLRASKLVRQPGPVKILGAGAVTVKLAVAAHAFSQSAREKIEKAGGSVELVTKAASASSSAGSSAGAGA